VDALASRGDEGREKAAKSFGEPLTWLWSGDVRMGQPHGLHRPWPRKRSQRSEL